MRKHCLSLSSSVALWALDLDVCTILLLFPHFGRFLANRRRLLAVCVCRRCDVVMSLFANEIQYLNCAVRLATFSLELLTSSLPCVCAYRISIVTIWTKSTQLTRGHRQSYLYEMFFFFFLFWINVNHLTVFATLSFRAFCWEIGWQQPNEPSHEIKLLKMWPRIRGIHPYSIVPSRRRS